jgi:PKD repeat protein
MLIRRKPYTYLDWTRRFGFNSKFIAEYSTTQTENKTVMQGNGSGMFSFDPLKGLFLLIIMIVGAIQVMKAQTYEVTLTVSPDCWGNETYWQLLNGSNTIVQSTTAGTYSYNTPNGPGTYTHTWNLNANETYTFNLYDTWGDGMTGSDYGGCNVDGDFQITSGGVELASLTDPDFGSSDSYTFSLSSGCTDEEAENYSSSANVDDGSCSYGPPVAGFSYAVSASGCGSATVAFTNSSTTATNYSWSFVNGSPSSSTETSPSVEFPTGSTYKVILTASNASGTDAMEQWVTIPLDEEGEVITFVLNPDCWASETSWQLYDDSGTEIFSVSPGYYSDQFPDNEEFRHSFCLTDDCYEFTIFDASGDGMEGDSYWSCDVDGSYHFEDSSGSTIISMTSDADFGSSNDDDFCSNYTYVWTGAFDSDWSNSGNWIDGAVPSANHSVLIQQTNYAPNLDETVTIEKLHIDSNSSLTFANSSGKLKLENDFINEGTLNVNEGLIIMQGDHTCYIKGEPSTFYKLKINSTDSVKLLTDAFFRGPLIPTKGVFDFNGNDVTLISEEDYTGSIGEIKSAAEIIGDTITIERYFPAGPGSWRMLCTPITDATFEQWNDDIPTTGFAGANYPNYPSAANPWSNIRYYDETLYENGASHLDSGFVSISNITDPIGNSKGYFVYLVPGPTTIDVTGTFLKGTKEDNLDFTESNSDAFNDGWNLVANPFPSAIDWDNASAWTKADLNNAIYAFDPVNGQYASYVNGLSVGSLSNEIASSQAFWVKSESGSPEIEVTEAAKINTTGVHMRAEDMNTQTVIRMRLTADEDWDETVIGFNTNASEEFDHQLDALKFYSPNSSLPNLATCSDTVSNSQMDVFSINMLPVPDENLYIDLIVKPGSYSEFTLSNEVVDSYDENLCMILEDSELGTFMPFNEGDSYSFIQGEQSLETRFALYVSAPLHHDKMDERCPGDSDGIAVVQGFGAAPWNFTWYNADGDMVHQTLGSSEPDTMEGLEAGFYEVVVENTSAQCNTATNVIEIVPAPQELINSEVLTLTCTGEFDGSLEVDLEETYKWNVSIFNSNNSVVSQFNEQQSDTTVVNLAADTYHILAQSSCGTMLEISDLEVINPQSVEAEFIVYQDVLNIAAGEMLLAPNTSSNAVEFIWNFGNGVTDSTAVDGQQIYMVAGVYEVTLTAMNPSCSDTFSHTFTVINETDETDTDEGEENGASNGFSTLTTADVGAGKPTDADQKLNINYSSHQITVKSLIDIQETVIFQIFNSAGQLVHEEVKDQLTTSPTDLQIGHLAQGVFYLNISAGDQLIQSEKFLKN